MKGRKLQLQVAVVVAAAVLAGVPALAAPQSLATVHAGSSSIEWQPAMAGVGMVLTVAGPDGFYLRQEFQPGESATFSVFDAKGQVRPAGQYAWELTPVAQIDPATAHELEAARESGDSAALAKAAQLPSVAKVQSGTFAIADQAIVAGGEEEPAAAKPTAPSGNRLSTKDQVFADDVIVQGSLCVGFDCVNNESFGFDTIRLKENNTRIKFDDTSTSSGFPNHDWQLTANDSASGGANKFSIEDISAATVPFTVTGSAPNNSIFVDSGGRVGLRTSTPVLDLQISTGNTPGIRLEQTGASGFSPQSWDIAGNETNFFLRDVTGGSKLPFRVRPGAPTSSIDIAASGNVGIGTASPAEALHVKRTSGSTNLQLETTANASVQMNMVNSGGQWQLIAGAGGALNYNRVGVAGTQFIFQTNGNMVIQGTLTTSGPTCSGGCDRVLSTDYKVEPIEEHANEMWTKSYLPAVGPTLPGKPINLSEKTGGMLNELEKAHIYIAQLNEQMKSKETEISELKKELESLKETVNKLAERK